MKRLIAAAGLVLLSACSSGPITASSPTKPKAYTALEDAGLTDITLSGAAVWGCSEDDSFFDSYDFTAKRGERVVSGQVCCGFGPFSKGCTVRY